MYTPGIDPKELAAYFQAQGSPWTPSDALGQRFAGGQQAGPLPGIPGAPGKQPTMKTPLPGGAQPGPGANPMPGGPPSGMDVRPNMMASLPGMAQMAASAGMAGPAAPAVTNGPFNLPYGAATARRQQLLGQDSLSSQQAQELMNLPQHEDVGNAIRAGSLSNVSLTDLERYLRMGNGQGGMPWQGQESRAQALQAMLGQGQGLNQGVNLTAGSMGQLMQQMAQYGPGGLAQQQQRTQQQVADYNTSQSRLGDQALLQGLQNGRSIGDMVQEMQEAGIPHSRLPVSPAGPVTPAQAAGVTNALGPPASARNLQEIVNRVATAHGGTITPGGHGVAASLRLPAGGDLHKAITSFMLDPTVTGQIASPGGYKAVRAAALQHFGPEAMNSWFSHRFGPGDSASHQQAVQAWMNATNQHEPSAGLQMSSANEQTPLLYRLFNLNQSLPGWLGGR